MKVLIIEDEAGSAAKLEKYLLLLLRSDIQLIDKLSSVSSSITFLKEQAEPDLIFLDIQLSDGESFQIFEQVQVESYIIFLTAYDNYSLQAFGLNSVDYLLKPFSQEDVAGSLKKFDQIRYNRHNVQSVSHQQESDRYRTRLLVKKGKRLFTIQTKDIAYFIKEELLFLVTRKGDKYLYEASLDELEDQLDPLFFFRINRQCIIHYDSIESMIPGSSHRFQLTLQPPAGKDLYVSQGKLSAFKHWLVR